MKFDIILFLGGSERRFIHYYKCHKMLITKMWWSVHIFSAFIVLHLNFYIDGIENKFIHRKDFFLKLPRLFRFWTNETNRLVKVLQLFIQQFAYAAQLIAINRSHYEINAPFFEIKYRLFGNCNFLNLAIWF